MRHFYKTLTTTLLATALCGSAYAQDVFIDNAKIITNSASGVIESGDVIVSGGRITRLGASETAPDGASVIDGENLWVTPGLFAPLAQVGLVEIGLEASTNDTRAAKAKTSVSDRVADSFNPQSPNIDNTRIEGITHAALTATASNSIFAGTGFVANMSGEFGSVEDDAAFVFVQYGLSGADLAGGTRAAALSQLRGALEDAQSYSARFGGPNDGDALSRRDAAALRRVLGGDIPIIIAADRASDLLSIIELKRRYSLDVIVYGAAEGWMVAEQLASAGIKVMIDPLENLPRSFDRVGSRLDNAALLAGANVDMALTTRSAGLSHNIRVLPQHAGNAVANGLDWDTAFAAISSVPARWFGIDSGTLRVGDTANLVVWNGDPLEVTSAPVAIFINGERQSLASRQTELRDRYLPNQEDAPQHKYR